MVLTVMKISFPKRKRNQITFRDYKTFNELQFKKELHSLIKNAKKSNPYLFNRFHN